MSQLFVFHPNKFLRSNRLEQSYCNVEETSVDEGLLAEETPNQKDDFNSAFSAVELSDELKTVPITRRNAHAVSAELEKAQENASFVIENYLAVRSDDNRHFIAFKQVFDELISRRQASKWSVARWQWTGNNQRRHDPRPSLCDFAADIFLAAKEVLTLKHYRILTSFAENDFRNWHAVPEGIRREIQGRVGANLIRKKIYVRESTKTYWMSSTARWAA